MTGNVRFDDGSTVEIKGKGSVVFKCKNGENQMLKDVYFIPSLCNNIVSLGQLSKDGKKVVLKGEFLWVFDEHIQLLMKVKRSQNRLYKVILEESSGTCLMARAEEETGCGTHVWDT